MTKNSVLQAEAGPRSSGLVSPFHGNSGAASGLTIVGIGASAGGLEACTKFMNALPAGHGMALILVQHLDPTHESMMVDLLASHTSTTVREATDAMPVERDHLYVIPPGKYLCVRNGALRLVQPQARHRARLPFDFLLHSLAEEYGARAVCVVLSGAGADGSVGLKAVKEKCGRVIAQDPDEAGYDGMPRNAIMTGCVDLVLPVGEIPAALAQYNRQVAASLYKSGRMPSQTPQELSGLIELLRTRTAHDYTLYKQGTLQRRIERRMTMAGIKTDDKDRYLEMLRQDAGELDLLAKDLLINVTSFFRDPKVFDLLKEKIIPTLLRTRATDRPIRVWIAGCSTGEETYSLAMLFREQITADKSNVKLQVFASDVDPAAVAQAREGLYPEAIEADVSPERLARFFSKEDRAYRVLPELRAAVVFTVQDVLADPPFSRLDMVSCRNLMIYLRPEAQAKVISLFHFALREGGVLLLGTSETVDGTDARFEVISKPERLYRHIGRGQPGDLKFAMLSGEGVRVPVRQGQGPAPAHQINLADLCRRMVIDTYAPAAVLINDKHECLYSLGPTDRYLHVASGYPTRDLLAMAPQSLRTKLRTAIHQAARDKVRVVDPSGRLNRDGEVLSFSIQVKPVTNADENLFLVCFVEEVQQKPKRSRPAKLANSARVDELERELETNRTELQAAIRSLEISGEEQKAINEEALSVNEEYQSTNEELLTSKEELQSLNEELTALNSQLQETLERQRTTSNDLQNILYSTNVATLFLDTDLKIRFFTPATRSLFSIIPGDVGRPLADLNSLASDGALSLDARAVLETLVPIEREIEAGTGAWYTRSVLPYRTQDNGIEGVVITFTDITERRHVTHALEVAKRQAELATVAKSRFLAAASHDLRQPLQTLSLMRGVLVRKIEERKTDEALVLVTRLDETAASMAGMLNTLLDLNQLEAGVVRANMTDFEVNGLLDEIRDELTYHAQSQNLALRVVPCRLTIRSDPGLLQQMIRNLVSNAIKYTRAGKVLVGCRRREGFLSIEIWDTGIGIPDHELHAIFEEYHQLGNPGHERSRGLGLGLSIVKRLGDLLGHRLRVESRPGKGSVFAIEIVPTSGEVAPASERQGTDADAEAAGGDRRTGRILVVEDDPETAKLLELVLKAEGHRVATAFDGPTALQMMANEALRPDLILADYNLPHDLNGLQVVGKLRESLERDVPVVMLTGDISASTLRDIALNNCVQLSKPVRSIELTQVIQRLLPAQRAEAPLQPSRRAAVESAGTPIIFIVDDDAEVRAAIRSLLEDGGRSVEDYATAEAFLKAYRPGRKACLLIDACLPGMNGIELLQRLSDAGHSLPAIMITGNSDVPMAVQAMRAGALDFIEKPVGRGELLASVERTLEQSQDTTKLFAWRAAAADNIAGLTPRQRQIMNLVLAGHASKNIAADLGISQRTVENHRAAIMKRTGSNSLPALARLAFASSWDGADPPQRMSFSA